MSDRDDRDRDLLETGISLGFAAAAGIAGESGLSGEQLGALLEGFSLSPGACATLATAACRQAATGRSPKPHEFRDVLAALMVSAKSKTGRS